MRLWRCIYSRPLLSLIAFISLFSVSNAAERTLKFPIGWEHATVSIFDMPQPSDYFSDCVEFDSYGKTKGVASGEVQVPDDAFVGIEVQAAEGYEKFLAELPTSGIHRIELSGAMLSDSTLRSLERVESLRELHLNDCTLGNIDVNSLKGASQLQHLDCMQDPNPALHKTIASWAAKCKQLQFFFDGHDLTPKEILSFKNHEAPLFLAVEFDRDAIVAIKTLSEVPNLIALNVTVGPDVPDDFHEALAKLERLEFMNWSGGQLDGDFLKSLAKLRRLRAIRIQGNAKVADDFIERLPELKNLEIIYFNFQLSDYQKSILPKLLLSMEKLREMPKLVNASAEQLQALSKRTEIRSLEIAGLDVSATADQLSEVILANPRLRSLILTGVPWTPEVAAAICRCEKLYYLGLTVDDFDGSLLKSPKALRDLETLRLAIKNHPRNLETLAQLPNLASIDISVGTYDKANWSFMADAESLRSIRIGEGFCDDLIVDYLQWNKNICRISTNPYCAMSDSGVGRLRNCAHLESIEIYGLISETLIDSLGQLPNLRSLIVGTNLLDEEAKKRLTEKFGRLQYFSLRDVPESVIGNDGFHRMVPDEGRATFDALEGQTLETMLGPAFTVDLKEKLNGKVVVVDFWGAWCGPCLNFVPELERLQSLYKEDGLQVLAIHSQHESETASEFVQRHPRPWPNVIDFDGQLAKRFAVTIWPSIYCFGRDGKLEIALPHRWSLQSQLEKLLDDPR